MNKRRIALASVAILLTLSLPLFAALTGDIRGTALDPQGLPVAAAAVTAHNLGTGVDRTTDTNASGEFALLQLDLGTYEIRVEKQGFRVSSTTVVVRSGEVIRVDAHMEIGAVSETVTVQAGAETLLDTAKSQVSTSLDAATIEQLPLLNRSTDPVVLVLATLAPGIAPVTKDNQSLQSDNFSANGQRGRANNVTVDNSTATDIVTTGFSGTHTFSLDSVQEFKIITNNFSAEFGRNAGSQVQIITKSGTNEYRGSAYWYGENSALNARDYFDTTGKATPSIFNQWGFTAGGPILKHRFFIFGQYEGVTDRGASSTTVATVLTPTQAAGISNPTSLALFNAVGAPTSPTGFLNNASPTRTNDYLWSVRFDGAFRDGKDILTARYGGNPYTTVNPSFTFLGTNLLNYGEQGRESDRTFNVGLTHTLTPALVDQLRFQYERGNPSFLPFTTLALPYAPVVGIVGFDRMGVASTVPQSRVQNVLVYSDSLSWATGRHALKFGGDVDRYRSDTIFFSNFRGTFTFANASDFQNGIPSAYTQTFGNPARGYRAADVALFAQDDIRVTPTFTLNLGLRFESSGGVSEVNNILSNLDRNNFAPIGGGGSGPLGSIDLDGQAYSRNNNWAPRLGAAWNPHHGRLVLRGGYGWIYDYLFLNPVVNLEFVAPFTSTVSLNTSTISGANSYASLVAGTSAAQASAQAAVGSFSPSQVDFGPISPVQQDLKNPRTAQWDFGVEYQFAKDFVVKATYVGNSAKFLQVSMPINLIPSQSRPAPATSEADEMARFSTFAGVFAVENGTANGSVVNDRLDHRFNAVTQVESIGNSNYDGLQLEVLKRMSFGLGFQGSYTYGRAMDDVSDALAVLINDSPQVQDPRNLSANWDPSQFDLTHRVVVSDVFEIPWTRSFKGRAGLLLHGWSLNNIFTAQSGFPATIFSGSRRGISDVALLGGGAEFANGDASAFHPAPFGSAAAAAIAAPCLRGVNTSSTSTCTNSSGFPLTQPLLGNLGDSGRNQLRLGGLVDLDLGLDKNTRINEKLTVQFRWEVYNVFNHPNFGGFVNTLTSSIFGNYTSTTTSMRKMQFALKFLF